jgi:hypothetical protein
MGYFMETFPKIKEILSLSSLGNPSPMERLFKGRPVLQGQRAVESLLPAEVGLGEAEEVFVWMKASLFLLFDCFEQSHQIAQEQEGFFGNWLHAMVHRREPDAENSKYWYQRVRPPEGVFPEIGKRVLSLMEENRVGELAKLRKGIEASKQWEPKIFVDLTTQFGQGTPLDPPVRQLAEVQRTEWQVLWEQLLWTAQKGKKGKSEN